MNKFISSKLLPFLNVAKQEIQLDYAGPFLDKAGGNIHPGRYDRYSNYRIKLDQPEPKRS